MDYILSLGVMFYLSIIIVCLGTFIGFIYLFLEWVTNKTFKWMYPISNILLSLGMLGIITAFIILYFNIWC